MPLRWTLAALSALALGLAACGDDTNESTTSTATTATAADGALSKSDYEQRFRAAVDKATRANQSLDAGSDLDKARQTLENMRALISELAALTPPAEVAGAHRDYVKAIELTTDHIEAFAQALEEGDRQEAERLANSDPANAAEIARLGRSARTTFERLGYDIGIDPLT